ncbi:uncharacterized protein [Clytia hemisphaerica]
MTNNILTQGLLFELKKEKAKRRVKKKVRGPSKTTSDTSDGSSSESSTSSTSAPLFSGSSSNSSPEYSSSSSNYASKSSAVSSSNSSTSSSDNESIDIDLFDEKLKQEKGRRKHAKKSNKKSSHTPKKKLFTQDQLGSYLLPSARFFPRTDEHSWRSFLRRKINTDEMKKLEETVHSVGERISERLIEEYGTDTPVVPYVQNSKQRWGIYCPVRQCTKKEHSRDIWSHLSKKHKGYTEESAKLLQSKIEQNFKHVTLIIKKNTVAPDVCPICHKAKGDITQHLKNYHKLNPEDLMDKRDESRSLRTAPQFIDCTKSTRKTSRQFNFIPARANQFKREENFRHTYDFESNSCAQDILDDFKLWLQTCNGKSSTAAQAIHNSVDYIWKTIDPSMSTRGSKIALYDVDKLEDDFFNPMLAIAVAQSKKPKNEQTPHLTAGTLSGKLDSLVALCAYSRLKFVYIGMSSHERELILLKVKEFKNRTKKPILQRIQLMKSWKHATLITPQDLHQWGHSEHVQGVIEFLAKISYSSNPKMGKVTIAQACDVRNYLMININIINGTRASNLMNISLEDIANAAPTTPGDGFCGFEFKSSKYKTCIVYGDKVMWVNRELYDFINGYIEFIRPLIAPADSKLLFTSSSKRAKVQQNEEEEEKDPGLMEHAMISSAFSRSFQKADVFQSSDNTRVSPSRLRCAACTELVGVDGENSDNVALHYMKHRPGTSRKYYTAYWENREALRISMKCYSKFLPSKETERIVADRNRMLAQQKPPSKNDMKKWFNNMAKLIQGSTGKKYTDDRLMACFDDLEDDNVDFTNSLAGPSDKVKETGPADDEPTTSTPAKKAPEPELDAELIADDSSSVIPANLNKSNASDVFDFVSAKTPSSSLTFQDDFEATKLPVHTLHSCSNRAAQVKPDEIGLFVQENKSKVVDLATGKLKSFRYDIYSRSKRQYFRDMTDRDGRKIQRVILFHELSDYSYYGGITELTLDRLGEELNKIHSETNIIATDYVKLKLDVIFPVVIKWYLSTILNLTLQEVEYYLRNSVDCPCPDDDNDSTVSLEPKAKKKRSTTTSKEWHACKKTNLLNGTQLRLLCFVHSKVIMDSSLPLVRTEYSELNKKYIEVYNFKMIDQIFLTDDRPWDKIKEVIRNIRTKYEKDPDGFKDFMLEGKAMWRKSFTVE